MRKHMSIRLRLLAIVLLLHVAGFGQIKSGAGDELIHFANAIQSLERNL